MFAFSSYRNTAGWRKLGAASLFLSGWLVVGGPQAFVARASGVTLQKGAVIDAAGCAYGPGQLLAAHRSGQYLADREAFYALTFLPASAPGGHFRFGAQFPRARWLSYQAFDDTLATQGVIDDLHITPAPGSVNPFLPGQHYKTGHNSYTVDVLSTPPAQRQNPPPPNVLYAGYRIDNGAVVQTPSELVLYTTELATGPDQQGGVPLPRLLWVVDNSQENQFQTQGQLCAALKSAGRPFAPLFQLNAILDKYVWTPVEEPLLKQIDLPSPLDPIPQDPPDVSVFRPSSEGYSWPLFNEQTPFILTGPSALFGRFIVIRFKAPTFAPVEQGIPSTGKEQTQYWDWCAAQLVSALFITTGCLPDVDAHIDASGYVTLVVSPASQRPTIDGKPYPDWLEWPGSGATVYMTEIDPNPSTFPQSPYFMPRTATDHVPYVGDFLPGLFYESQIRTWMSTYYPQVSYCG